MLFQTHSLYHCTGPLNIFYTPIIFWVELQEMYFKTYISLTTVKRGAIEMFFHEVGEPQPNLAKGPQKASAGPACWSKRSCLDWILVWCWERLGLG